MAHCIADKARGLVAAMVAVFAAMLLVPGTVFATPVSGNVTITGLVPGDTVTLYKVIDIDINNQNVAEASWVDELAEDDLSLEDWESYTSNSNEAIKMANQIAKLVSDDTKVFTDPGSYATRVGTVSAGSNSVEISDVESGQYLVVVSNEDVARVYQDAIVTVQPIDSDGNGMYNSASGSAALKATDMTSDGVLEKKIDENGTLVDTTDNYDFTENVDFQITTLVPLYTNTNGRTYTVTDTMSDGLSLKQNSFVVTLDKVDLTENVDYTLTSVSDNGFTLSLTEAGLAKVKASSGAKLVITFSAAVDDDVTYANQEANAAKLEFSTDSVSTNTDKTEEDKVTVTFYAVQFTKVGEKEGSLEALKGAKFELKSGDNVIKTITTGDCGRVKFDGLAEGTYTVHEATAPAGYAPIEDFTVTIADDGTVTIGGTSGMTGSTVNRLTTITGTEVDGQKPSSGQIIDPVSTISLPVTGGTGTIAMTAVGVVIIAGAAAYILRSRKQN